MFEYTILTLGYFSRNKFWGEDLSIAHRPPLCTSTWIAGAGKNILVDPSMARDEMAKTIDARTGKTPSDVDIVYITHAHGDHFIGLDAYPSARILVPSGELDSIREQLLDQQPDIADRVEAAAEEILPGLRLIPLPGHTLGLCGLIFDSVDGRVAVSGDSVMTRDFFRAAEGYFNSADFEASTQSIRKLAEVADVVVPGHDNGFWVRSYRPESGR